MTSSTGMVVFITGLPSSGKSSFAERVARALRERGDATCVLDGDAVRACLLPKLGYSSEERGNFYATLARLAALLARQGLLVLVPATANRAAYRDEARRLAPRFLEAWVDTPLEECARRDTKGLYAKARAGTAETVPGVTETYEPPPTPDLVVHGGDDEGAAEELLALLARARD
jgi:adenylylsulfate kinase